MSPQSTIRAQDVYGLSPARGLKPRNVVWRDDPARIARGPNLAPGSAVSIVIESPTSLSLRQSFRDLRKDVVKNVAKFQQTQKENRI